MMKENPHFKLLGDISKRFFLIFCMIFVIDTISFVSNPNLYMTEGKIIYTSQVGAAGIIISMIYGSIVSTKLFSGAMNIRADRISFIKSFIIWSIIISLSIYIISILYNFSYKIILQLIYQDKEVLIWNQIRWTNLDEVARNIEYLNIGISITSAINNISNNLLIISIGFMMGAISYRLKKISNLILFIGLPVVSIIYLVHKVLSNMEAAGKIGMQIMNTIIYIIENPMIFISLKSVGILVFILIGIKFLIKAPIKEYAHDLI